MATEHSVYTLFKTVSSGCRIRYIQNMK